ncbi:glutathione S-transferase family protein [Cobetia sp. 14N.309.X.WAT.E.A4]|uniref:glutathione S-transferase family protein n=1 Tax=Cobetia sp. 14N.309.X.WAT.E.A4 TaxID=2998323 RepID=UPI0025AFF41D|nr:glutathione S-transferase family protein [Cobetia sp. 14N.309.X.WAT.E.A4]MDN2655753.1 glutathione S-transferase family protein [Cobetia sp. 14N.309.X.WAT.E.A4]
MGLLVDGTWQNRGYDTDSNGGEFKRESASLRDWVVPPGAAEQGPDGQSAVPAEVGRYHLYVSLACPWAHRALVMRSLKGLTSVVGMSYTSPYMLEHGWSYLEEEGSSGDPINGVRYHHQLYTMTDPHYTGRVTVPALWDRKAGRIVNNESADLVRIFNDAFDPLTGNDLDFSPEDLRGEIDALNAEIYDKVNNGVYKTGFATSQQAYERHFTALFACLDSLERRLADSRYLVGEWLTEADIRLFTTLLRFDVVYHGHFKCNQRRISDYPNLSNYLRELYQWPGVAETCDLAQIKTHYYGSQLAVNPTGIVPLGPMLDLEAPHDRERLTGQGIRRHH